MASKINADEFVDREGEGKPTLPKGVVLSGVTTITTAVVAENEVANSTGINAGIITSTHFKGNLTGDVNAGIVTVTSQTVVGSAVTISASGIDIGAGVITATSYAGSGANLTGIGATIMVWEYNPDPYDTAVTLDTGIGITFNQKIKAGSGNITLSIANAGVAGTVVENFGIGNSVTISGNELSFTPTSNLTATRDYCVTLPSGVITNMAGESYVGTAYTFQARAYTNQLWIWGGQDYGQLGQNQSGSPDTDYSSPVQIPGTTWSLTKISSGYKSCAAIRTDGTAWAWGRNNIGQLGQSNKINYSSPVQLPGSWNVINMGYKSSAAINTSGELVAMGSNNYGQLGQNNRTQYSSPVQIPGTTWSTVRSDTYAVGAIKTDGTLWTWGYNLVGQLGHNEGTNAHKSSPVQIPGTTWSILSSSLYAFALIKTDGTLWAMGRNDQGDLGVNDTTQRSSPTQVPGTTWSKVVGGNAQLTIALKTDGTLWSWGINTTGELGLNDTVRRSSPTQIPGTTWSDCTAGDIHMAAIKTDGTAWAWGRNEEGQLGQNNTVDYSSPVQITGTDWYRISGSIGSSGAVIATKRI